MKGLDALAMISLVIVLVFITCVSLYASLVLCLAARLPLGWGFGSRLARITVLQFTRPRAMKSVRISWRSSVQGFSWEVVLFGKG